MILNLIYSKNILGKSQDSQFLPLEMEQPIKIEKLSQNECSTEIKEEPKEKALNDSGYHSNDRSVFSLTGEKHYIKFNWHNNQDLETPKETKAENVSFIRNNQFKRKRSVSSNRNTSTKYHGSKSSEWQSENIRRRLGELKRTQSKGPKIRQLRFINKKNKINMNAKIINKKPINKPTAKKNSARLVAICKEMLLIPEVEEMYSRSLYDLLKDAVSFESKYKVEYCMNKSERDFIERMSYRLLHLICGSETQEKILSIANSIDILIDRWTKFTLNGTKTSLFSHSDGKLSPNRKDNKPSTSSRRPYNKSPISSAESRRFSDSSYSSSNRIEHHHSSKERLGSNIKDTKNTSRYGKRVIIEKRDVSLKHETTVPRILGCKDFIAQTQPMSSRQLNNISKEVEAITKNQLNSSHEDNSDDDSQRLIIAENNETCDKYLLHKLSNEEIIDLLMKFENLNDLEKKSIMELMEFIEKTDKDRFEFLKDFIFHEK